MAGHAQDVQVAVADLEREQDVDPPQRQSAVDVEEVTANIVAAWDAEELALASAVRLTVRTRPSTCRKSRYSSRSETVAIMPDYRIADHRWSAAHARFWNLTRHPISANAPVLVAVRYGGAQSPGEFLLVSVASAGRSRGRGSRRPEPRIGRSALCGRRNPPGVIG